MGMGDALMEMDSRLVTQAENTAIPTSNSGGLEVGLNDPTNECDLTSVFPTYSYVNECRIQWRMRTQ